MSDCGCVYAQHEGEEASFIAHRVLTARQARKCCECGDAIAVGDRYELTTGNWFDNRISAYHTCLTCYEIRKLLFCDSWMYGAMWEDIDAYFDSGGNPMGCINKLESALARERLSEAWREYKGLAEPPQERER